MLSPKTESELAEAIAGAKGPLRILGGGTRGVVAGLEGDDLGTRGLSGITLYEPGALTLVVQAGTPLAEVEAALSAQGQRLPFEPMDHRAVLGGHGEPTIGGVVAGNVSGPRRIQAGACRDSLIGVRFVDGRGVVIKNGGRVMKNVTGYDLVKLMAGSFGTLGVLSEVSFKLLPAPEAAACLLLEGLSDHAAVAAMAKALGSPFEVTGAAHVPVGPDGGPVTMIRIEGFAASVAYRLDALRALLADLALIQVEQDPAQVARDWRWVRDLEGFAGTEGDIWRISVKPSEGPGVVDRLDAYRVLYDWGGGLIWAEVAPGRDLRAAQPDLDGHMTLVRAGVETRKRIAPFQPQPARLAALSRGLRRQFDPRAVLNTGLMG